MKTVGAGTLISLLLISLRWRVVHGRLRVRCNQDRPFLSNMQSAFTRIAFGLKLDDSENGVLAKSWVKLVLD